MKGFYSKNMVRFKIEEMMLSRPFDIEHYFFLSRETWFNLAETFLQLDSALKITLDDVLRYRNHMSENDSIALKDTLTALYQHAKKDESEKLYISADNITEIVGWEQCRYLMLHLLFLLYEYCRYIYRKNMGQETTKSPIKYHKDRMDFILQEIVITINSYILLSYYPLIDLSDNSDSYEKNKIYAEAILTHIEDTRHMTAGDEFVFPAGVPKVHAIYLSLKKIEQDVYEMRVDNAGMGSNLPAFNQGSVPRPRVQGLESEGPVYETVVVSPIIWRVKFRDPESFKAIIIDYLKLICRIYNKTVSLTQLNNSPSVLGDICALQRPREILMKLSDVEVYTTQIIRNDYPNYPKQSAQNCVVHGFLMGSRMRLASNLFGYQDKQKAIFDYQLQRENSFANKKKDKQAIYLTYPPNANEYDNETRHWIQEKETIKQTALAFAERETSVDPKTRMMIESYCRANLPVMPLRDYIGADDLSEGRTGRLTLLNRIYNSYSAREKDFISFALVHGLSGVGKTTLVNWYAQKYAASYDLIRWFEADSSEKLKSQFGLFAKEVFGMSSEEISNPKINVVEIIYLSLQKLQNVRWLLIFDDAKHPDQIAEYLPNYYIDRAAAGHCLITSHYGDWSPAEDFAIDGFTDKEVESFISKNLGTHEKQMVLDIAKILDYHPYAMMQTTWYLKRQRSMSIQDYYDKLINTPTDIFSSAYAKPEMKTVSPYPHKNVFVALSFTIQDFLDDPNLKSEIYLTCALYIIQCFAYFHLSSINKQFFQSILLAKLKHQGLIDEKFMKNIIEMICNQLLQYKILTFDAKKNNYELHHLMSKTCALLFCQHAEESLLLLLETFNRVFDYNYYEPRNLKMTYMQCLYQLQAMLEHINLEDFKTYKTLFYLYLKLAHYHYYEHFNYLKAMKYYQYAEQFMTYHDDIDSENKSELFNNLASLMLLNDMPKQAVYYSKQVFVLWKTTAAHVKNLHCVFAISTLARCAIFVEDFKRANVYFERCLKYLNEENDEPKLHMQHTQSYIASDYSHLFEAQGDYDNAIRYALKALEYKNLIHSNDSFELFTLISNIGTLYFKNKEFMKARDFLLTALEMADCLFGRHSLNHLKIYYLLYISDSNLNLETKSNHREAINIILDFFKTCPHEEDIFNTSFLQIIIGIGLLEDIQWLIKKAKISSKISNKDGQTVLLQATVMGHLHVVQYLLVNRHSSVLEIDNNQYNALMLAAWYGHLSIVIWLKENTDIELSKKSKDKKTAFDIAIEREHTEVASYLNSESKVLQFQQVIC